jgi:hypothetical protein
MLNTRAKILNNTNYTNYHNLIAYLKKLQKNHSSKQASVFEEEHVESIIKLKNFKIEKVVFIIGFCGLLRAIEICNLNFEDVIVNKENIQITIKSSKTSCNAFNFFITEKKYIKIIEDYIKLVPKHLKKGRFLKTMRNGKVINSNFGINSIRKVSQTLAKEIKIENFENFTSHAFRRSGATYLANKDTNSNLLKKAGRWFSDKVVSKYIDECKSTKLNIANKFKIEKKENLEENLKIEEKKDLKIEENLKIEEKKDLKIEEKIEEKKDLKIEEKKENLEEEKKDSKKKVDVTVEKNLIKFSINF